MEGGRGEEEINLLISSFRNDLIHNFALCFERSSFLLILDVFERMILHSAIGQQL